MDAHGYGITIPLWGKCIHIGVGVYSSRSDCNGQFLRPHRVERVTGTGSTSFLFMYHTNTKILSLTKTAESESP